MRSGIGPWSHARKSLPAKPPSKSWLWIFLGALLLAVASVHAEDPLHEQTEQFFPLPLDGVITLENAEGSIHIYGWYEPRVRLASLRNAYTAPRLHEIRVETKAEPAALAIRTVIPPAQGFFADRSGTVDYSLNVPEAAHLRLKLATGEITLQGLRGGQVQIELTNGRVFANNCYARVEAHSLHGTMDILYEWWENLPAAFVFTLEHGRIGARLPATAQLRVDVATANGQVGNGFGWKNRPGPGPGHSLLAASAPGAPVSFHFRTGGGNISIDSFR